MFCRDPSFGQQIVVAKSVGLSPSTLVSPNCVDGVTAAALIGALTTSTSAAVGFVVADNRDYGSAGLTALAFQAQRTDPGVLTSTPTAVSRTAGTCATVTTPSGATST